jgi:hypothetical protein
MPPLPGLLIPSIASTFWSPTSGVRPPPSMGVRADARPDGASTAPPLPPPRGSRPRPVRGMWALPDARCSARSLSSSLDGFSLLVACASATSSKYLRCRSACLFLLGGMPWNLCAEV